MNLYRDGEVLSVVAPVAGGRKTGGFGDEYVIDGVRWYHRGWDVAPPASRSPVRAMHGGVVCEFANSLVWFQGQQVRSFGFGVCIDAGAGRWRYTLYAHNSQSFPNIGDRVIAGQVIALTGATGVAYGEHLHVQRSESSWFPADLARNTDPEAWFATEEEMADPHRLLLNRAANGPFVDMVAAYDHLRPLGFFDPWIERDGEPGPLDGQSNDGDDARARRYCLDWLAATDRAKEAVEALGWL